MLKPALPGQTSDMSNIRKTKKFCNYPKTCFTMANIRFFKRPKNQESAANIRKAAFPGQICDMSDI